MSALDHRRRSGSQVASVQVPTATARAHLQRVQDAWWEPDWSDLALYGFYCLEAAVGAADEYVSGKRARNHPDKVARAKALSVSHGLPDVSALLVSPNDARKAVAYGDVPMPNLDAEDVAGEVEGYVEAVAILLGKP